MAPIDSIKPFWPMLFTFVLPRALGYYRALKTAYRTRPPPRPLPRKASRSLNVLFVSICIFLWLSTSSNLIFKEYSNIFTRTQSRIHAPTDVLFGRLANQRVNGKLNALDEELRLKLLTIPARQIYLRYGPETLLNCPFCHPDQPLTYLLHYLPANILLPHLLHLVTIGLATSRSLSGLTASHFRLKFIIASIVLLILDIYVSTAVDLPPPTPSKPFPQSLYAGTATARPLLLAISDITFASLIYLTSTARFIFFPFLASASSPQDPEELLAQTDKLLNETAVSLQMAHMKLRGLNIARSTISRDETLKTHDASYWSQVRSWEDARGGGRIVDDSVFEDEEVQAAMARAFGSGNVDVQKMRRDAAAFVKSVTGELEKSTVSH